MKKNRILSLILAFVMIISLLSTAAFAVDVKEFNDLNEDAWYYEHVERVTADEYFIGIGNNKFDPEGTMTRAMFVTVLYRIAGKPDTTITSVDYTDVNPEAWYMEGVIWGQETGLIKGYEDGTFKPDAPVARDEMCVFMSRYIDWHNNKYFKIHETGADPIAFTDAATIGAWAKDDVEKCVAYGLINGFPVEGGFAFKPEENSTRAQVAKVVACLAWKTALSPDDLIGHAVRNSMTMINDNYIGRVTDYIGTAEGAANGAGLDVSASDFVSADLFTFRTEVIDGTRPQYMSVTAKLDREVITKLIDYVVSYAYALTSNEVSLPTKDEVVDVVVSVKNEVEDLTGLTVADSSVTSIADHVYNKLYSSAYSIWSNFKTEEGYVTGDITVSVGDFSAVVNVDEKSGVSVDNKIKSVVGLSVALAKELYASMNEEAANKWVSEFKDVSATVTLTFSPSAVESIAKKTAPFPYVYPVTLNLALENNMSVVQYMYDGMPNVKFVVSDEVQDTYEAAVQAAIEKILSSETLINQVEGAIAPMLSDVKTSAQIAALADVLDATGCPVKGETAVSNALTAWKNANLYKDGSIAYSPVYEMYWAENTAADWNNTALYGIVTLVANSAASYVDNMIDEKAEEVIANLIDEAVAELPENAPVDVKDSVIATITNGVNSAVASLKATMTVNYLNFILEGNEIDLFGAKIAFDAGFDLSTVPAGAKDFVLAVICDELRDEDVFATADAEAAMKADIDAIIDETVAGNDVVEKLSAYLAKGNFFTEVDEIANVKVSNIATLVRVAYDKTGITALDRYVDKACDLISKLPDNGSIVINGVVFEESNALIQNIKNATTLEEACEALAQLIEQPGIGDLCINSFAEGIVFTANYGARSYSFKLFVDVQ